MTPRLREAVSERLALDALDYDVPRTTDRLKYMLGGLTAFLLGET